MKLRLTGFIIGVLTSLIWPQVPSSIIALVIMAVGLSLFKRQALLSCLMLGIGYCSIMINYQFNDIEYLKLRNSSIKGTIISLPQQRKYNNRFFFKLSSIMPSDPSRQNSRQSPIKSAAVILVYWGGEHQLQQGQRLALTVKVRPIHGYANQGGFNYQKWLISQGVMATASVVDGVVIDAGVSTRARVAALMKQATAPYQTGNFIRALTIADKQCFNQDDWDLLAKTGTSHLFAISGLHLSMVFACALLLLRYLLFFIVRVNNQWLNNKNTDIPSMTAAILALVLSVGYSYLAGFSLPTIRALIMLSVLVFSWTVGQKMSLTEVILYSLAMMLLLDPIAGLGLSFWLSFSAVCSLLLLIFLAKGHFFKDASPWQNGVYRCYLMCRMQCWLFVCLLGIQLFFFSGIAVIAPVANVIAVPVVGLLVLPCVLIAMLLLTIWPWFSDQCFALADWLLRAIMVYLDWLTTWPGGWFANPHYEFWLLGLAALVFVTLLKYCQVNFKVILMIVLLMMLNVVLTLSMTSDTERWQVHFLDVGQGNAAVIIKNRHAMVIDAGKKGISDKVIIPFLAQHSIKALDYIVLTHQDSDHSGGSEKLMTQYLQATVISNVQQGRIILCGDLIGKPILWQGLTLVFFATPPGFSTTENDNSCVLRLSDQHHSVLFSGDISKKSERYMVKHLNGIDWHSEVLQVPHHGSRSSSSKSFIQWLKPQVAVVSAARFNQWHFPAQQVVNRYHRYNVALYNTAQHGQVTIEFAPHSSLKIRRYRQDIVPFWYNRLFYKHLY